MNEQLQERLSTLLFAQNQHLCFFQIDQTLLNQPLPPLPLLVHHNHYACIYYQEVYLHYKHSLPQTVTANQLRFQNENSVIIPSHRPIGLYINKQANIKVIVAEEAIDSPYNILYRNWKQAFHIINEKKQAYVFTRILKPTQQQEYFNKYKRGQHANIENEASFIAVRGFANNHITQRKHRMQGIVLDLFIDLWPGLFDEKKQLKAEYSTCRFKTHGVQISPHMKIEILFFGYHYNDGYCYICLEM